MTTETLADQIQRVRERLLEIEDERANIATDDFSRKADLVDEERMLSARLAELREQASQEMTVAQGEASTDARRAEDTRGADDGEDGKASGYERVPDEEQELNDTDGDQR